MGSLSVQDGHKLVWKHYVPVAIQRRANISTYLQKHLCEKDALLGAAMARYMSDTAERLFAVLKQFPDIPDADAARLLQNVRNLTETVEPSGRSRHNGRLLREELEAMAGDGNQVETLTLEALEQKLADLLADLGTLRSRQLDDEADQPMLSDVILKFLEERGPAFQPGSLRSYETVLRTLIRLVGNKPVRHVTRQDIRAAKETLMRLPAHWERNFPGVPIEAAIKKGNGMHKLSRGSINRYLAEITSFFSWALNNGYIDRHPALRLTLPRKTTPNQERDRYATADLDLIFHKGLQYAPYLDPHSKQATRPRDHKFWLPLISLFSGMRLGEAAHLLRGDIREIDGVWCFDVQPNDYRPLKTASSRRVIPVHPEMLRIGWIDEFMAAGGEPEARCFPAFHYGSQAHRTSGFSSYWSRQKRLLGITHPRKTFHSFRHTFIDELADKDIRRDIVADLAGHYLESQAFGRYRKRADIERLHSAVARVGYEVDLSHLYR